MKRWHFKASKTIVGLWFYSGCLRCSGPLLTGQMPWCHYWWSSNWVKIKAIKQIFELHKGSVVKIKQELLVQREIRSLESLLSRGEITETKYLERSLSELPGRRSPRALFDLSLPSCHPFWPRPIDWTHHACWECLGQQSLLETGCWGPVEYRNTEEETGVIVGPQNTLRRQNLKQWQSCYAWCRRLTSIVRLSLSFLQEAEMVSEVANSKYHSLFFILQAWKKGRGRFGWNDVSFSRNISAHAACQVVCRHLHTPSEIHNHTQEEMKLSRLTFFKFQERKIRFLRNKIWILNIEVRIQTLVNKKWNFTTNKK